MVGTLTAAIFVINLTLHRPVIDALLFSLAIAVGISPQLLLAVVSTSVPLLLAVVTVGAALPASPFGRMLGFQPLPGLFFLALVLMVVAYLLLIELGKYWFYRSYRAPAAAAVARPVQARRRRVHRRAARFTTHHRLRR